LKTKLLVVGLMLPFINNCSTSLTTNSAQNVISLENTDFKKIKNYKRGEACKSSFLGFTWGSNLVTDAAASARISKARFVESEFRTVFFVLYIKNCTILYGE
jgi:hypothetical protein